jgi:putative CocE/NonD family hydrolase
MTSAYKPKSRTGTKSAARYPGWLLGALFFALAPSAPAQAQAQAKPDAPPAYDVKANYTKYEYRIPMRDGVHLFTSIYVPKDTSKKYPFLLNRTPYSVSPYGVDHYRKSLGPSIEFEKSGYIFVNQDVRGRFMSEGKFQEMTPHIDNKKSPTDVDDSSDTYDTIEWLLKNIPNNNGRAGIWGISYPGFYTSASMIDTHPALKAASPEAPMTDLFKGDDAYHGGAFMLAANMGFYVFFYPQQNPTLPQTGGDRFDFGTNDGYDFYLKMGSLANSDSLYFNKKPNWLWDDQIKHDTYDEYWKVRNLEPHLKNIHCAVLTVGGWFDAEDLAGPFKVYADVKKNDPGIYNGIVVGPWVHGGWAHYDGAHLGNAQFDSKTGEFYRTQILFPFFEQYLKDGGDAKLPEAYVFETGTNQWKRFPSWPPAQTQKKTLYFRENGALSWDAPAAAADAANAANAADQYVSDPNQPVPYVWYPTTDVPQEYMVSDQRFASTRPDVLTYQTEPLQEDVTIAGPISPKLFVSTTGTDSDFVVKVIDVYPADYPDPHEDDGAKSNDVAAPHIALGGYQQLLRGEPLRGKFRNSMEKPEPFTPGKVETIAFDMPDVFHTFRRGHRIMVQVQSSWFPLIDRNPQTFTDIPYAKPSDFQKATEKIYRGGSQASGIVVGVMPSN